MSEANVLTVTDLSMSFGNNHAVSNVTLSLSRGQVLGIIGPNGSGKSTLFNCVSGVLTPTNGTVQLGREAVTGLQPHKIARMGLGRTFQIPSPFRSMTVMENMLVPYAVVGDAASRRRAEQILEMLQLLKLSDEYAGNLSGGQLKLLELGRVLICEPSIVLLDEIGAGVNPVLKAVIAENIRHYSREGVAFLLIEHDMDFIQNVCDEIIVMAYGEEIVRGSFQEVTRHPAVIDSYLGAEVGA